MVYRGGRKANNMRTCWMWKLSTGEPMVQWCKRNGLDPTNVRWWLLKKGLSVDEACQKALEGHNKRKNFKPLMYKGVTLYKYFSQSAYNSIQKQVSKNGLSIEEALELYEYNKTHRKRGWHRRKVIHVESGEIFDSIKECAKHFKKYYHTMKKLVKQGKEFKYAEK